MITDPKKRQERREIARDIKDEMNRRRREKAQRMTKVEEERLCLKSIAICTRSDGRSPRKLRQCRRKGER